MKKLFTLFALVLFSVSSFAQMQGEMTFVGEATFGGTFFGIPVSQTNPNDTIRISMAGSAGDILMPSVTFTQMGTTIPSFTIKNAPFSFDFSSMTAKFGSYAFSETVLVNGAEKTISGTLNSASYTVGSKVFYLNVTYKYGSMPGTITYEIAADYLPTAIRQVDENKTRTTVFDLSGRQVSSGQRGLVIKNGKKYWMK